MRVRPEREGKKVEKDCRERAMRERKRCRRQNEGRRRREAESWVD